MCHGEQQTQRTWYEFSMQSITRIDIYDWYYNLDRNTAQCQVTSACKRATVKSLQLWGSVWALRRFRF